MMACSRDASAAVCARLTTLSYEKWPKINDFAQSKVGALFHLLSLAELC